MPQDADPLSPQKEHGYLPYPALHTNNRIVTGATFVKALHIIELRSAVDQLRGPRMIVDQHARANFHQGMPVFGQRNVNGLFQFRSFRLRLDRLLS